MITDASSKQKLKLKTKCQPLASCILGIQGYSSSRCEGFKNAGYE